MGSPEDVAYGEGLLQSMRPFIENLIAMGLRERTIRDHIGNLWLLGGEIIRDVNTGMRYSVPPLLMLKESVGPDGGPYCRHLDAESQFRSFDNTCRRLHRFLTRSDLP